MVALQGNELLAKEDGFTPRSFSLIQLKVWQYSRVC